MAPTQAATAFSKNNTNHDISRTVLHVQDTLKVITGLGYGNSGILGIIPDLIFPTISGPAGQKYYPGFCPGYVKPNRGKWIVNDEDGVSENTLTGNVLSLKFYIPNEQYTGLTETTTIKCSSFVLQCTISVGTLDPNLDSIEMATIDVPRIEFLWDITNMEESDPAIVKHEPLPTFEQMLAAEQERNSRPLYVPP